MKYGLIFSVSLCAVLSVSAMAQQVPQMPQQQFQARGPVGPSAAPAPAPIPDRAAISSLATKLGPFGLNVVGSQIREENLECYLDATDTDMNDDSKEPVIRPHGARGIGRERCVKKTPVWIETKTLPEAGVSQIKHEYRIDPKSLTVDLNGKMTDVVSSQIVCVNQQKEVLARMANDFEIVNPLKDILKVDRFEINLIDNSAGVAPVKILNSSPVLHGNVLQIPMIIGSYGDCRRTEANVISVFIHRQIDELRLNEALAKITGSSGGPSASKIEENRDPAQKPRGLVDLAPIEVPAPTPTNVKPAGITDTTAVAPK